MKSSKLERSGSALSAPQKAANLPDFCFRRMGDVDGMSFRRMREEYEGGGDSWKAGGGGAWRGFTRVAWESDEDLGDDGLEGRGSWERP